MAGSYTTQRQDEVYAAEEYLREARRIGASPQSIYRAERRLRLAYLRDQRAWLNAEARKQRANEEVRASARPGDELAFTITGYLYNLSESRRRSMAGRV